MPRSLPVLVLLAIFPLSPTHGQTTARVDFEQPDARTWQAETTQANATPAAWGIDADPGAPSPRHVLNIQRINDRSRNVYNLYWTREIRFHEGTLGVDVRANTGVIDQGGGIAWRIQDARNYYIARYNPLERNLRVYIVRDGKRRLLDSQEGIALPAGRWWRLEVTQNGNHISVALNGVTHLTVTDDLLTGAGGVGLWAKADAASSFDDLSITPARVARGTSP